MSSLIFSTDEGILTSLSFLQCVNAPSIFDTVSGIVIFSSSVQYEKAHSPIEFTLSGIISQEVLKKCGKFGVLSHFGA